MTELGRIRVGIAGWSNPPATRTDRQPAQSHLGYYAEHFSCVEINSSFHRPIRAATFARWREETPAHFRFSVKMPRSITHDARLRRTATDVSRFYEEICHLQPKLAAVLVQLPPSLEFSSAIVRSFFNSVPRVNRTVVTCEPRHESWFSAAADQALRRVEVARAAADPARYVGADVPAGTLRFAYFRWHGAPQMYYSKYSDAELATFAIKAKAAAAKDAWCIFDNTARHAAWDNALRFISLVRPNKARGKGK